MKEKKTERRERKKEKEKWVFLFSLRFTKIGLSFFVGARGKVGPCNEATRGYQNLGVSSNPKR